jgi:lipopolysaccharide/colanic/teichoic acid biosynthesis glycosyltransferase
LPSPAESRSARLTKRLLDVALSAVGLLFGGPLALAAALLVRMESRGPLFYAQERCGRDGKRFRLWKLRTMVPKAEAGTGPVWSGPEDPRCTRIGAVLRRTGIDELPQLWNVLKGEMSLVGPRPERPHFVRHFQQVLPDYAARHRLRPGLTGLAQVNGWRGRTCVRKRLEHDLRYVANWNLGLDLKLIALTAFHLISGSNGSATPPG